jgi:hypothetical protein
VEKLEFDEILLTEGERLNVKGVQETVVRRKSVRRSWRDERSVGAEKMVKMRVRENASVFVLMLKVRLA